jgi:hypothetical protein
MTNRLRIASLSLLAVLTLAACGRTREVQPSEYTDPRNETGAQGQAFDDNVFSLGVKKQQDDNGGTGLGVNAYLWRGALDTLAFMPLSSADPFGGVIITDWYQPPTSTDERFKATAYILGRQLRADGVRISIFRQVRQDGQWVDAPVSPATSGEIADKVLARARELRSQTASN